MISAVILVTGLATGILAARLLGPQDRGYLGMIVFWPQFFAAFARFPYADSIVVHVQSGDGTEKIQRARELVRYAFRNSWLTAVAYAPIVAIAIWIVLRNQPDVILTYAWCTGAFVLLFLYPTQVYQGLLGVTQEFGAINLLRLAMPVGYLLLIIVFFSFGLGLAGFVTAFICSLLLEFSIRFFGWRNFGKNARRPSDTRAFMKTTMSFHALTMVGILATQIDRALLLPTSAPETIGLYFVALSMTVPIQSIINPILLAIVLPLLAALDETRRAAASLRLLRLTHTAALVGAILVAIIAPFATPLLFGDDFAPAGLLTSALAIAGYLIAVRQAFAQIFKVENNWKAVVASEFLYILAFALAYVVALAWGANWPVVIAFAAGNLSAVTLYTILLRRRWPEIQTLQWLVPRLDTLLELARIGLSGLKRN